MASLHHLPAQALRDYETLSQESLPHNPFAQQWLLPPLAPTAALQPFAAILRFRELDKKDRLAREKRSAALERLLLGSFGGLMLIGPMLVMVLHYTRNTTLVTTSVATALFTLVLAMFARAMAGKDVLAAVAAYAAVLMVFVGTSLGSGAGA